MKIDPISWKILECLQQNARQSNTAIAKKLVSLRLRLLNVFEN